MLENDPGAERAAADFVDLLVRRHSILAELTDDPRSRHVLVDALDDSKTTVYKGVSQLLDAGLLEQRDGVLHPTLAGRVALARYRDLAAAARLPAVLETVPTDALDPVVLDGCELVTPDEGAFDRHIAYGERLLEDAERVRGIAVAVSEDTVAAFRDAVVEDGIEATLVLPSSVADRLATDYADVLAELDDDAPVTVLTTDADLAVSVLVVDRPAGRTVAVELTDGALPVALLLNDSPDCVAWADARIDEAGADATTLLGG